VKIPKKVKIGALFYKVNIVDGIENKNDALGHTSWHCQEIEIVKGKPDYMLDTFLHEVFHAFNVETEDIKIQNFADRMLDFILDNPKVFK
jgi:hypothetical protein